MTCQVNRQMEQLPGKGFLKGMVGEVGVGEIWIHVNMNGCTQLLLSYDIVQSCKKEISRFCRALIEMLPSYARFQFCFCLLGGMCKFQL